MREPSYRLVDAGDRRLLTVDGREWKVDAARVDSHLWSLLIARLLTVYTE